MLWLMAPSSVFKSSSIRSSNLLLTLLSLLPFIRAIVVYSRVRSAATLRPSFSWKVGNVFTGAEDEEVDITHVVVSYELTIEIEREDLLI